MIEVALWIWSCLATIGALASAFVRWRSSADETTGRLWKDEAEAWKAKAERLESMYTDLAKRVDNLESENRTLRALHDNREEMLALGKVITEGFADLKTILREVR